MTYMKRAPMLFAALVPFAVAAGGDKQQVNFDKEKLRHATPMTAVLDEDVRSRDGHDVGDVEEVIINRDGKVQHVLIERDMVGSLDVNVTGKDAGTMDYHETAPRSERKDGAWTKDKLVVLQPDALTYNATDAALTISLDGEVLDKTRAEDRVAGSRSDLRASDIIGMEAHLADDDSFGRIEDLMLSKDGKEIVAVVVDSWEGMQKNRHAFPIDGAHFNSEEDEVTWSMDKSRVQAMNEFNLDRYGESGWTDLENWADTNL